MRRSRLNILIILSIALIVAACDRPTPAPLPDALSLLEKAAADIQATDTVQFKLQLQGAPAFIDDANTISFVSADGNYVAPNKVSAKVSAAVFGIPGQIDIAAVGDDQFYKHVVLTGNRWLKHPFSPGFNADKLIRSEEGIKRALKSLQDVKMVGKEDRFGAQVYHITGKSTVAEISALTVNLIRGTGDALVDVYIAVDTGRVDSLRLVQPETVTIQYTEPTTWTMELFNYNDRSIRVEVPTDYIEPAAGGGLTLGAIPTAAATADPGAQATSEATTNP